MGQMISSGAVGFGSSFVYSFDDGDLYIEFEDLIEDAKDPSSDFSVKYPLLEVVNAEINYFTYGVFAVFVKRAMVSIEGMLEIHQSLDFEITPKESQQLDMFISENPKWYFTDPGNQIVLGVREEA